jgi:hypothetical protein
MRSAGRSIQAIDVINKDSATKVIIVCPASMRIPWRREMERWLDRPLSIGVTGVDNGSPHAKSGRIVLSYRDSADGKLETKRSMRSNSSGAGFFMSCLRL